MVALKGKRDIGDQINKRIFGRLTEANEQLSRSDFPNFNDPVKLGDDKEMVDRLTNLIAYTELARRWRTDRWTAASATRSGIG